MLINVLICIYNRMNIDRLCFKMLQNDLQLFCYNAKVLNIRITSLFQVA